MENNQIMKELRKEAIKYGKMGDETISITLNKGDVDIETLSDEICYELDGDSITLSCDAEIVY